MDCFYCNDKIDKTTEYYELHHHRSGSDPIEQHTFCSRECLFEHFPDDTES